jgi:hypothetical protein
MARCPAIGQKMKPGVAKSKNGLKIIPCDACVKTEIIERYEHAD